MFVESLPEPGEVFDRTRLEEFFKVNRTISFQTEGTAVFRRQRGIGLLLLD
jgi:hypothetical protein